MVSLGNNRETNMNQVKNELFRQRQLGRMRTFLGELETENSLKKSFDAETESNLRTADQIADEKHVLACIERNKSK